MVPVPVERSNPRRKGRKGMTLADPWAYIFWIYFGEARVDVQSPKLAKPKQLACSVS
jgi:hypothetical protein